MIDRAFTGTPCTAPALSFTDIANESMMFHRRAFPELEETAAAEKLEFAGWYKYIKNKGEFHMNNPDMSRALHRAVREKEPLAYEEYRRQIMDGRPVTAIRDLLDFASDRQPVPLQEVEDATSICSRFVTGGMSLGALSREAHEVIALGMNRVGGMSNSGEGGEDPLRFHPIEDPKRFAAPLIMPCKCCPYIDYSRMWMMRATLLHSRILRVSASTIEVPISSTSRCLIT